LSSGFFTVLPIFIIGRSLVFPHSGAAGTYFFFIEQQLLAIDGFGKYWYFYQ